MLVDRGTSIVCFWSIPQPPTLLYYNHLKWHKASQSDSLFSYVLRVQERIAGSSLRWRWCALNHGIKWYLHGQMMKAEYFGPLEANHIALKLLAMNWKICSFYIEHTTSWVAQHRFHLCIPCDRTCQFILKIHFFCLPPKCMQSLACHRLLRGTKVASEEDQWAKNIESHAK